jgi:hypothetical protein
MNVSFTVSPTQTNSDNLTLSVENLTVRAGESIEVPIRITNNPGVATMRLNITLSEGLAWDYDPATYGTNRNTWAFTEGDVLNLATTRPQGANLTDSFVSLQFPGSGENTTANGVLVTLKLRVRAGFVASEQFVNVEVVSCMNQSGSSVRHSVNNGRITVLNNEIIYGDVDGNGVIDDLDLLWFTQYLNGWNVEIGQGADVNGDGIVDDLDLLILMQYLNGWDVVLGRT